VKPGGCDRRVPTDSQFADFAGPFLDAEDVFLAKPGLPDHHTARQFCVSVHGPIGHSLRVGELSFTVIGVFRERVETFGLSEISGLLGPRSISIDEILPWEIHPSRCFTCRPAHPRAVIPVTRQLEALLSSRHPRGARYFVQNLSSILEAARKNRPGSNHRSRAHRFIASWSAELES